MKSTTVSTERIAQSGVPVPKQELRNRRTVVP
jgi:hypothetical protein